MPKAVLPPRRMRVRANGRSVVVTITDRGPFVRGRVIDLPPAGARAIGLPGLARVDGPSSLGCVAVRGNSLVMCGVHARRGTCPPKFTQL